MSIQGNEKHTTVTSFWSGRFMFPHNSAGAIVPIAAAPLGAPFAAEGERQATIRELMPYFLRFCQLAVGIQTMDVKEIHFPRIPKREVTFLTPDEIHRYVGAIPVRKGP